VFDAMQLLRYLYGSKSGKIKGVIIKFIYEIAEFKAAKLRVL